MSVLDDARAAIGFLTRLPVQIPPRTAERTGCVGDGLAGAGAFFPLVGLLVAGVGVVAWLLVEPLLGGTVAAVVAVLATIAITGALHEDGLADVADGFWGGAYPARRLEIMRDSRIGTFGVLALAGELLLRIALLVPLDFTGVVRVLVAGHVVGRAAPLVVAAWLPPARSDGLGIRLGRPRIGGVVLASGTVVAATVATAGVWAPLPLLAGGLAAAALGLAARRRIGGFTGDVLGAAVLLVNLVVGATVAVLLRAGWV